MRPQVKGVWHGQPPPLPVPCRAGDGHGAVQPDHRKEVGLPLEVRQASHRAYALFAGRRDTAMIMCRIQPDMCLWAKELPPRQGCFM